MFGDEALFKILDHPDVTGLLDDPAFLFNSSFVPRHTAGGKTINFYRVGPVGHPDEYLDALFVAACRAPTEEQAARIALAVRTRIDREFSDEHLFKATILPPVRPADDGDLFNVPVNVRIFGREIF